jgi:type I restriction enzyme S subunit
VYGISKTALSKLKLNIPPILEQKAIAEILITADKEITELQKKLSIIKDQKKFLLNNLITGTIRTPETLSIKL